MDKIIEKWKALLFGEDEVDYISGSESLPPPLPKDEELACLLACKEGDEQARNKLIEHNLRLVVYVAKRYDTNIVNLEDLISIGTLGLIKAIATFKLDRNIKLATYASRCIENEILMHLRKKARRKNEISIDDPLNTDYDGNELLLSDILSNDGEDITTQIEKEEEKQKMYEAIATLKPREQEILSLRFGLNGYDEMTQKDVAEMLGISQSYISRLEKRIIKKLKDRLNKVL